MDKLIQFKAWALPRVSLWSVYMHKKKKEMLMLIGPSFIIYCYTLLWYLSFLTLYINIIRTKVVQYKTRTSSCFILVWKRSGSLFLCRNVSFVLRTLWHIPTPKTIHLDFLTRIHQLLVIVTLYKRLYLLEPLWKLKLPLDGSKCHLFHFLIIHTPEALPHGMVQPITAAMLERFQNLNKTSQPYQSYQSM